MPAILVCFGVSKVQFSHCFLIFCNISITPNQMKMFPRTIRVTLDTTGSIDSQIACKLCTFLSPRGTLICLCGKILDELYLQGKQSELVRICQNCTFHNSPDSVECTICEEDIENYVVDIIVDAESETDNLTPFTGSQQSNAAGPSNLKLKNPFPTLNLAKSNYTAAGPSNYSAAGPSNYSAAGPSNIKLKNPLLTNACNICCINKNEFMIPICGHFICNICAVKYFAEKIAASDPYSLRCPISGCTHFTLLSDKKVYFKLLTPLLERILDDKMFHEFLRKTKTIQIMKLRNYVRSPCCNRGFTVNSKITTCRKCSVQFCSNCCKMIKTEDDHIRCKKFEAFSQHQYEEIGTFAFCSQCKNKYFLESDGCMHLTCNECSAEQCSFCQEKFTQKEEKCGKPNCMQGLHAHHPRRCMYYLREMNSTRLEKLLEMHSVSYDKSLSKQSTGNDADINYVWYLGELTNKYKIDPVDVMDTAECICELNRHSVPVLQPESSNPEDYVKQLRHLIRTSIPY